jgi:hypothetical protein
MPDSIDPISGLAARDAAKRILAARWFYRRGCQLAEHATQIWREDPAFAALLEGLPTVGIAVHPQTFERIHQANGAPRLAEVPPDQDAKEFELHFEGAELDILTTCDPGGSGAIAKFLDKFGEGIQQVEYFVRDVDRATEILRTRLNIRPIYPQTRPGADATRVNFFLASHPKGQKVLIELVQKAGA